MAGTPLKNLLHLYKTRSLKEVQVMQNRVTHCGLSLDLLPSGSRNNLPQCRTNRFNR